MERGGEQYLSDPVPEAAASSPRPAWTERLTWGALLTLAWLIYELTARPTYGIAVACAKFGWEDFLTACWLIRRDRNRGRGRSCFYFYVAIGLWKITIASCMLTGAIHILVQLLGARPPRELLGLGILALIGINLLAIIPLLGAIVAQAHQIRVWIDPAAHASRRANLFPPQTTRYNLVPGLLFPALVVPLIVTAVLTIWIGIWTTIGAVLGEGLLMWALFRSITARQPEECWGTERAAEWAEPELQAADN